MTCAMPHPHGQWITHEECVQSYWSPPPYRRPTFRRPPYDYRYPSAFHEYPPEEHAVHSYYAAPPLPPPPPSLDHRSPLPHSVYTESTQKRSGVVYEVNDVDILCGRGAPTNYHPGNQYFRGLITKYQTKYLASKRIDKPEIATHIVTLVRERGGRFLKRTKVQGVGPSGHFCWQDIGEQRAYEKVCQALREGAPEIRRRMAAKGLASIGTESHHIPDSRDEEEDME